MKEESIDIMQMNAFSIANESKFHKLFAKHSFFLTMYGESKHYY